jgi:RHS repeat-associated protein
MCKIPIALKRHNANNQRVAKEVNGTIVQRCLWLNNTTLLGFYDKEGNFARFTYATDRTPIQMDYKGTTYYLSYNRLGSLKAIRNQSNTIIKQIDYDSFGNVISQTNPTLSTATPDLSLDSIDIPLGFAGGLYDKDTNLIRFGYRDYDPYTGRWTAKDPIDFSGGDSNLYAYVGNDPINYVDPEGKVAWFVVVPVYYWVTGGVVAIGGAVVLHNILKNNDRLSDGFPAPPIVGGSCPEEIGAGMYDTTPHGQGERNRAAKPEGSSDPFKHMKLDPTNPDRVLGKDANGHTKPHPKPPGFDEYWNKKHQKK